MNRFDERARDWDSDPAKVERAKLTAQAIQTFLPPGEKLTALEYGCGTGLLSFALKDDFNLITMVDSSQGMLDVLSEKIRKARITNMIPKKWDFTNQDLPSIRVDVIFSLLVLHHIPDTGTILRHFSSLLNPNGYLFLADLEKEDGSFHGKDVTDVHRGFDHSELSSLAEAAGFQNIRFSPAFSVTKKIQDQEKIFPVFLMSARKNP